MDDENSVPLNVKKGLQEFDNNVEFYKDLITEFLEHIEKKILVMGKAVIDKDSRILKQEAHAIKGGAANLNAHDLSKAAYKLDDTLNSDDPLSESTEGVRMIEKEFCRLKKYLINHDSLKL